DDVVVELDAHAVRLVGGLESQRLRVGAEGGVAVVHEGPLRPAHPRREHLVQGPPSELTHAHPRRLDRRQMRRRTAAQRVSSCLEESCSLRSTAETRVSTVLTEMNSSPATSL